MFWGVSQRRFSRPPEQRGHLICRQPRECLGPILVLWQQVGLRIEQMKPDSGLDFSRDREEFQHLLAALNSQTERTLADSRRRP